MRALAAVLVAVCLAGCSSPAPTSRSDREAPVRMPEGFNDNPEKSAVVTDCGDPGRSFNPARRTSDEPTLSRITDDQRLVVGMSQTAPLMSSRDLVTGRMTGFEVDIITRIAEELFGGPMAPDDPRLRMITMPTGKRLNTLDTPENRQKRAEDADAEEVPVVDLVIADVSITCERVKTYGLQYSTPYLSTHTGLMIRKGMDHVRTPDDLAEQEVCSGGKTTNSDEMIDIRDRQKEQGRPQVRPVTTADTSECLMLLQRGLVDAIYTDVLILEGYRQQDPGTVLLDYRDPKQGEAGIAMSKEHPDLVRFVNGVLDEMRADGSLEQLRDKHFLDPKTRPGLPAARYLD